MLKTIDKIFANILYKRVKTYLQELNHVGQTSFMENICIIDNMLTFWEVTALAKKKINTLSASCQTSRRLMTEFNGLF